MDDRIDATPTITAQTTISETADSEAEQSIEVSRSMMQIRQSLLHLGYNAIKRSVKGELCLEKDRVGQVIIRPNSQNGSQIEIFTMAYTGDGVTVEDTVETLVRDSDNFEFAGEPKKIPMGLCWPVKIIS